MANSPRLIKDMYHDRKEVAEYVAKTSVKEAAEHFGVSKTVIVKKKNELAYYGSLLKDYGNQLTTREANLLRRAGVNNLQELKGVLSDEKSANKLLASWEIGQKMWKRIHDVTGIDD